ncbi:MULTISPECIES: S9 family peptidase [Bacillaceae]|uniref:S9 family peptidase n=1 Tax=Evansella alkalicola TaxID=745819 RepID=A0ABS6JVH7_9BACI|nr:MULTISPECIES: S9 family peptidase [Bacillaceae]MBU9722556.1 S9 family peptidase [Bacillus alkalicola]
MSSKRSLTKEDLKKINVINDPHLSPDGSRVAYVQQFITDDDKYTSHLFVQSTNESEGTKWTYGNGRVFSPRFSPDGKWLVFVAAKGEQEKPQLHLLSLAGGEARPLTTLKNGASQPFWSPDSQKILFTTTYQQNSSPTKGDQSNDSKGKKSEPLVVERLKYKSDASGFLDGKRKQLAIYELSSESITYMTDDDYDHEPSGWSPDGKKIVYSANKAEDHELVSHLYLLDIATKSSEKLTKGDAIFTTAVFSPDGNTLAFYGHKKEFAGATQMKLWTMDLNSKKLVCLTNNWDVHVTDAAIGDVRSGHTNPGPIWSKDGSKLYITASTQGNTNFYSVSLNGQINDLYSGKHHVYGYHVNPAKDQAVLGVSTPTNPGDLHVINLTSGHTFPLTDANKWLEGIHIQEPEEIHCKTNDGWEVHGWVLKPHGYEANKKYPTILEIHGGPHAMYGNTFFHELQLFAAKGYIVLYSNPRGSHGYGQTFVDACRGDYGGKDYEDLMAFLDASIEKHDCIDVERLGVTGGSYGGFMTNWIVSHTNRFKAAATLRCISNWISFYGVSDIGYFFTEWEIGTDLLKDPEKLWNHSPLKYVNNIETPLLILHGERDFRCPVEQAEQLFVALKHRGKDTRFVRFPDSNHELSRSGPPHLRLARLEELTNWFDKFLK